MFKKKFSTTFLHLNHWRKMRKWVWNDSRRVEAKRKLWGDKGETLQFWGTVFKVYKFRLRIPRVESIILIYFYLFRCIAVSFKLFFYILSEQILQEILKCLEQGRYQKRCGWEGGPRHQKGWETLLWEEKNILLLKRSKQCPPVVLRQTEYDWRR
jgi:hypothetical protein